CLFYCSSLSLSLLLFFCLLRPPPCSTLFPYTTLFRSRHHESLFTLPSHRGRRVARDGAHRPRPPRTWARSRGLQARSCEGASRALARPGVGPPATVRRPVPAPAPARRGRVTRDRKSTR